jgi:hypothetical protein
MNITINPSFARALRRKSRELRAYAKGKPDHIRERVRIARKSLVALAERPTDAALAVQVAMNVANAQQAA